MTTRMGFLRRLWAVPAAAVVPALLDGNKTVVMGPGSVVQGCTFHTTGESSITMTAGVHDVMVRDSHFTVKR